MNYLAHAYLSFNNPSLLVGNMIADYVKGKQQYDYSHTIQAGIQLHRAIDFFTDTHEATLPIKNLFKPAYRLYASAFVDVVLDYFLANDKLIFNNNFTLINFVNNTYALLDKYQTQFPHKFANMYPYMKSQNWLLHYGTDEGMQKSFNGLQKRAKYIIEIDSAFELFLTHKSQIALAYQAFFPELKSFANSKVNELLKH